jgi:GNAT superfamily N-acetyltransferase
LELKRLEPSDPRLPFSCGDQDLDEFFAADSAESGRELMAVTYALMHEGQVQAYFAISNDAIKTEDVPRSARERLLKLIPRPKRYNSMPAAKIGRLGVCEAAARTGVGTQVLDFLKVWFTHGNKTGCRFLIVDAYSKPKVLNFYLKNGFKFLTSVDEKEETRIMYFDLKTFGPPESAIPSQGGADTV